MSGTCKRKVKSLDEETWQGASLDEERQATRSRHATAWEGEEAGRILLIKTWVGRGR